MATVGARLVAVAPGYCAIDLVPTPALSQQHGYLHAGVVAMIVDSAGGYAGFTLFPATASVLSVEFKLNLLAPAQCDRIVAAGFVVDLGADFVVLATGVAFEAPAEAPRPLDGPAVPVTPRNSANAP